jgi:hypothetical protein
MRGKEKQCLNQQSLLLQQQELRTRKKRTKDGKQSKSHPTRNSVEEEALNKQKHDMIASA